jgi:hypothetical protein
MNFELEFYHKTEEELIRFLKKRFEEDVPSGIGIPLSFNTHIALDHQVYRSNVPITHKVKIHLFERNSLRVLSLKFSLLPLQMVFLIILLLLGLSAHFILGNLLLIIVFLFSMGLIYGMYRNRLSAFMENYVEQLKAEILHG